MADEEGGGMEVISNRFRPSLSSQRRIHTLIVFLSGRIERL